MKAVIMNCDGKSAVILKNDGTFSRIKDNNYKVGEEILLRERKAFGLKKNIACAVAALAVFISSGSLFVLKTPYSSVELNGANDMELTMNMFDNVIDVKYKDPENKDKKVIESILEEEDSFKGTLKAAIKQAAKDGSAVKVEVNTSSSTKEKELQAAVKDAAADDGLLADTNQKGGITLTNPVKEDDNTIGDETFVVNPDDEAGNTEIVAGTGEISDTEVSQGDAGDAGSFDDADAADAVDGKDTNSSGQSGSGSSVSDDDSDPGAVVSPDEMTE
jgi:hypothetical protein